MSEQGEGNVAVAEPPRGNSKVSDYTVMVCDGDFATEEDALDQGDWRSVGLFTVQNGGQREARKSALEANPELRDKVEAGEPLWVLCLPMRSTHTFRVRLKPAEPTLLI